MLEVVGGEIRLNGARTESVDSYRANLNMWDYSCLKSSKTGNTFCYTEDRWSYLRLGGVALTGDKGRAFATL